MVNGMEEKMKKIAMVAQDLNEDIMYDIFVRLPADTLEESFKYQCKQWFNIISNPSFIDEQLHRSKAGIITVEDDGDNNVFRFMEFNRLEFKVRDLHNYGNSNRETNLVKMVSSSNGLVLLQHVTNNFMKFYVVNPLKHQKSNVPHCPGYFLTSVLVFVPTTKEYKVVHSSIMEPKGSNRVVYYVLSLSGSNNALKRIEGPQLKCIIRYGISINGLLFNIVDRNTILSLDVGGETFQLLELPTEATGEWKRLFEMNGHLSCVTLREVRGSGKMDIWTLKDPNREKWTHEISDNVEACDIEFVCGVVGCVENGRVIIFQFLHNVLKAYDVKAKQWKFVMQFNDALGCPRIHVNSLFSLKNLSA